MDNTESEQEPIDLPIDGVLDLHTFLPREIGQLLPAYLEECRQRKILQVRIIHGKGTGTLRRTVTAQLDRLPFVRGYRLGDETSGSWGATIVDLAPPGTDISPKEGPDDGRTPHRS